MDKSGKRVTYDRFWGLCLLVGCVVPANVSRDSRLWHLLGEESLWSVRGWLLLSLCGGLFGIVAGVMGWRARWRHFINFALGALMLGLPLVIPEIWRRFPEANPASLPIGDAAEIGWVMLVALVAIYTGSGIRVVRPSHIAGPTLGALGALLLSVFAFLPPADGGTAFGVQRAQELLEIRERWRELLPFVLVMVGTIFAIFNLVRSSWEVWFARLTRVLLVAAIGVWLALPFLEGGGALRQHVPQAWGALHFIAPLFLSLDGAVAFTAIAITRSSD